MNIKQVYIDEYGHLKHASYQLSSDHLVILYGLNEAGKSTLFHFIETMLFGFSRKKAEVEHYSPTHVNQYGGYCVIELSHNVILKVTRYLKQHKGLPTISKLSVDGNSYAVVDEQVMTQDEFERLYLTSINRSIFRDLCALTLDELQATSMQDDEQLNQHLYHATWESSKLISQLEKKSQDALTNLYRPRGSKQRINIILNDLKHAKQQLSTMENELDAYELVQHRLADIQKEEQEVAIRKQELEQKIAVVSKAEQDFPLYQKQQELAYTIAKLQSDTIDDRPLLSALRQYRDLFEQQHHYITDIKKRKQELLLDLDMNKALIDEDIYKKQHELITQYSYIEPLLEDTEVKQEQLKKQRVFIKQKTTIGGVQLEEINVLAQQWQHAELEQLMRLEEREQKANQDLVLNMSHIQKSEQRLAYLVEQQHRLNHHLHKHEQDIQSLPYTFIPQQLDDVIRLEVKFDEAVKGTRLTPQPPIEATRSRAVNKGIKHAVPVPLLLICGIGLVAVVALLITQLTLLNLFISLLIIMGCSIYAYSLIQSHKNSSKIHQNPEWVNSENHLMSILSQFIVLPPGMHNDWSIAQDVELRQSIQHYKQLLKQKAQDFDELKMVNKEKFDLSFQLKTLKSEQDELQVAISELVSKWQLLLTDKRLPLTSNYAEVRQFVGELDAIKHNIADLKLLIERQSRDTQRITAFESLLNELAKHMAIPAEDGLEYVIDKIKVQYMNYEQADKLVHQLYLHINQLETQLHDIEAPVITLEHEIRERYPLARTSSLEQWQTWLAVDDELEGLQMKMFQLEQQRRASVSDVQMNELNQRYVNQSIEDIRLEQAQVELDYGQVKQLEISLLEERGQLQERVRYLSSTTEKQALVQRELMLEEQLTEALREYAKHALVDYLVTKTREQFEAEHQPALMQKASQYISQLTAGKYNKIVLQPDTHTFLLATSELTMVPIERLSRGTAELVYFCLRVALLTINPALQKVPLILDDPFVNFDARRQKQVIQFIHQLAKERQLLLLTCHTHIVEVTQQTGQAMLVEV